MKIAFFEIKPEEKEGLFDYRDIRGLNFLENISES